MKIHLHTIPKLRLSGTCGRGHALAASFLWSSMLFLTLHSLLLSPSLLLVPQQMALLAASIEILIAGGFPCTVGLPTPS